MSVFLERFVLAICAGAVIGLVILNALHLALLPRLLLGLLLGAIAFLAARRVQHASKDGVPIVAETNRVSKGPDGGKGVARGSAVVQQVSSPAIEGASFSPPVMEYHERPYPREIIQEINERPPFQQPTAAESYLGLRVSWDATFESVFQVSSGLWHMCLCDRGSYPWIYCDVDIKDFPELKIAKKGAQLRVAGEIIVISDGTITLAMHRITW